jgi:hypothetical protein
MHNEEALGEAARRSRREWYALLPSVRGATSPSSAERASSGTDSLP